MKPSHFVILLAGLTIGLSYLTLGKRSAPPPPPLPHLQTKAAPKQTKRGKRADKKRVALRWRRRGKRIRIKSYTSQGPFLFYQPKKKPRQQWKQSLRLQYTIRYETQLTLDLSLLPNAQKRGNKLKQFNQYLLTGSLHLFIKKRNAGTTEVAAQLSSLQLKQNGQSAPPSAGLTSVFWFQFQQNGEVVRFRYPHTNKQRDRNIQKEIVEQLAFVLPKAYRGNGWTLQRKDDQGSYTEQYRWLKRTQHRHGVIDTFMRRKRKYIAYKPQKFVDKIKLHNSLFRVNINTKDNGIASVIGSERFSYQRKTGQTWMTSAVSLAFHRVKQTNDTLALWSAKPGRSTKIQRLTRSVSKRVTTPYTSLQQALTAFPTLRKKSRGRANQAVADYLKANPNECNTLTNMIKNKNIPEDHHAGLIHSLELSNLPEAQQALSSMYNDKGHSQMNRLRAIVASNGFKPPTQQLVSSLWNVHQQGRATGATVQAKSRASTALLALGVLSSLNASTARTITNRINQQLINALKQSRTPSEKRTALIAIKNAATSSMASVVVPYVHDPSPLVRQAAINALQAIPGHTGIPALASQLVREASPFVQTAILQTLTTKKQPIPAVQQWLKTHVPQAKHASLRLAMINHLGTFMATYPTNKQLLISMMRTESNPTRIRLIAKYIHQK